MTEHEKRSLKIRLGQCYSTDKRRVFEIAKREIDKTPTTPTITEELEKIKEEIREAGIRARNNGYKLIDLDCIEIINKHQKTEEGKWKRR